MRKTKNTVAAVLCAAVAGIGVLAISSSQAGVARAESQTIASTTPASSSMSIAQMQQIINLLKQQIQQIIVLMRQMLVQSPICGNGKCETGETAANCAKDCAVASNCAKEGEVIDWRQDSDKKCCDGLTEIIDCDSPGCSKSSNSICAYCGNGVCGLGENSVNCSKDCPIPVCNSDLDEKQCALAGGFYTTGTGGCLIIDGQTRACGVPPKCVCEYCGNGACETGETAANCAKDCAMGDCVIGIIASECCSCPKGISRNQIGSNGWVIYEMGKDYSAFKTRDCSNIACAPCGPSPETVSYPEGCALCGNGACEVGENCDNCSQDCHVPSSGGIIAMKPIIYLYPQSFQSVNVKLDLSGELIADYPDYNPKTGWNVTAYPDGRLINLADGKEYGYLFWEGADLGADYDMSKGFVVEGSKTKEFLQTTLAKMGLTPKEYNEFIVYWYPKMKDNSYNIIHFAAEEYTSRAKLTITPAPDSMLRVFMVYKPSEKMIDIEPQTFERFARKGFTVVEWGGSELK